MSKSLIVFIGEDCTFDKEFVINSIKSIAGVSDLFFWDSPSYILKCSYTERGLFTSVYLSRDLESIAVDDIENIGLSFVVKFSKNIGQSLQLIDTNYSFHISLDGINSVQELENRMGDFEFED